jgi:hypothetical protein
MLMLIPLNFKEWNALCVITCNNKKIIIIIHKVEKGLVKHNKDHGIIAMNDHVSSKHCVVLALSQTWWQFVITVALINHQIIKKRKNSLTPNTTTIYYYHGIY